MTAAATGTSRTSPCVSMWGIPPCRSNSLQADVPGSEFLFRTSFVWSCPILSTRPSFDEELCRADRIVSGNRCPFDTAMGGQEKVHVRWLDDAALCHLTCRNLGRLVQTASAGASGIQVPRSVCAPSCVYCLGQHDPFFDYIEHPCLRAWFVFVSRLLVCIPF